MSPEGEKRIGKYPVDGYHEESNTVFEFHGIYWHGHPSFFNHEEIHPTKKQKTYGQLFKKTLHKEMMIRQKGYNYICLWEHEDFEQTPNIS